MLRILAGVLLLPFVISAASVALAADQAEVRYSELVEYLMSDSGDRAKPSGLGDVSPDLVAFRKCVKLSQDSGSRWVQSVGLAMRVLEAEAVAPEKSGVLSNSASLSLFLGDLRLLLAARVSGKDVGVDRRALLDDLERVLCRYVVNRQAMSGDVFHRIDFTREPAPVASGGSVESLLASMVGLNVWLSEAPVGSDVEQDVLLFVLRNNSRFGASLAGIVNSRGGVESHDMRAVGDIGRYLGRVKSAAQEDEGFVAGVVWTIRSAIMGGKWHINLPFAMFAYSARPEGFSRFVRKLAQADGPHGEELLAIVKDYEKFIEISAGRVKPRLLNEISRVQMSIDGGFVLHREMLLRTKSRINAADNGMVVIGSYQALVRDLGRLGVRLKPITEMLLLGGAASSPAAQQIP